MREIAILITSIFTIFALTACSAKESKPINKLNDDKLQIYTTVYPLTYFTEEIGKQYVDVKSIYPSGIDEHTFEPTQKDMISIADADLFFYIGLDLEAFVPKAAQSLKNENVEFLAVAEKLSLPEWGDHDEDELHGEEEHEADHGHEHGLYNPHVWLDPIYSIELAREIKTELAKQIPAQKDFFEENFQALAEKLTLLNEAYKAGTADTENRSFLVTHDAFSYWEDRYDIEQLSIIGSSTVEEPSPKQLKNLIDVVNEKKLRYILVEQNVNKKFAETISKETGAMILPIHNMGTLSEDEIKQGADYFSIAYENLDALQTALKNE